MNFKFPIRGLVSDFLESIRFLTVIPIPLKSEGNLARAMFFFPLVGCLMGILTVFLTHILSLDLFLRLEALGLVTFPILLSGGLHLDGLADFSDGFFGGRSKSDVLRIMRDSRIGTWGTLGVILVLFWKWELLTSLSVRSGALILSLTASRWAQVVLAYFLPYANPEGGLGEAVAKKVKIRELVGATAFLTLVIFFLKGPGVLCFMALIPFLGALGFFFHKRVDGVTGDLLGAASELTEVYLLFVLFLIRSGEYR